MAIDHAHKLKKNRFDKSKRDWLIHFFGWAANQRKSSRLAESTFLFPTYLGRSKETLLPEYANRDLSHIIYTFSGISILYFVISILFWCRHLSGNWLLI